MLAVRPNSRDINKLIITVSNLCKFYNAEFTLLHVINMSQNSSDISNIKKTADSLLSDHSIKGEIRIEQAENPTECVSELTAEYDLLVIGTPRKDTWTSMLFGTGKDKFASNSACSVLRLTIKD